MSIGFIRNCRADRDSKHPKAKLGKKAQRIGKKGFVDTLFEKKLHTRNFRFRY